MKHELIGEKNFINHELLHNIKYFIGLLWIIIACTAWNILLTRKIRTCPTKIGDGLTREIWPKMGICFFQTRKK